MGEGESVRAWESERAKRSTLPRSDSSGYAGRADFAARNTKVTLADEIFCWRCAATIGNVHILGGGRGMVPGRTSEEQRRCVA